MNTEFAFLDRQLTLIRYPQQHQHKSLQAWDSADELLIEEVNDTLSTQPDTQCIIFNDDFGALGCWFSAFAPTWVSDSWIAHRSLQENLKANGITERTPTFTDSLAPLPAKPDLVLIKIPRTLALLEQQLIDLRSVVTPSTRILAAAKAKTITKSVLGLFERYLGPTTTSLAKKKSRAIYATVSEDVLQKNINSPYPTTWPLRASNGKNLTISNYANVFSRQSLDIGARFMLEHMQAEDDDNLIDLGCGNGVLGLNALAMAPNCKVTFVDESYMAIASAKANVAANFPKQMAQCEFIASNCLEALLECSPAKQYAKVLCNPPFHQQNTITDHIAWQMFHDARELLAPGGHLIVVGNRHLNYHNTLKRLFGGVKLLASQQKFVILAAAKR